MGPKACGRRAGWWVFVRENVPSLRDGGSVHRSAATTIPGLTISGPGGGVSPVRWDTAEALGGQSIEASIARLRRATKSFSSSSTAASSFGSS
jgi:hypothetical protein